MAFLALLLTGIGLSLTLLASQIGGVYFLTNRLDAMGRRLDGCIDRMAAAIEALTRGAI